MARPARDIVVIGGSAGALSAATGVLEMLPAHFPGSVFVALHRHAIAHAHGLTPVLARSTRLPTEPARDRSRIEPGHVYVADGDHHVILENGIMRTYDSPRENRFRPGLDALFKSAATSYGHRVIGVLLSGINGGDGPAGLWQIKHRGGVTIVQDPANARFPGMPQSAIDDVQVDFVLPVDEIGATLIDLVCARAAGTTPSRILIVEDESVIATNLQQSLTQMGYEVVDWLPTGEAAIELAEREHPDLILMDIHLAGTLDGIESAREIWQKLQIPIVYCTAHADLDTLKAVQTTESYGYVVKPFESAAVRAVIELALARREKELR
jgi:chemotaxis response regulator CheB